MTQSTSGSWPKKSRAMPMRAPFERVDLQMPGVVGLEPPITLTRRGIGRVDASHRTEHDRDVVYVSRHGTGSVESQRQRDDAVTAQQTMRRLEPDDAIRPGGPANRAARVGAQTSDRVHGGNRNTGAA